MLLIVSIMNKAPGIKFKLFKYDFSSFILFSVLLSAADLKRTQYRAFQFERTISCWETERKIYFMAFFLLNFYIYLKEWNQKQKKSRSSSSTRGRNISQAGISIDSEEHLHKLLINIKFLYKFLFFFVYSYFLLYFHIPIYG